MHKVRRVAVNVTVMKVEYHKIPSTSMKYFQKLFLIFSSVA